MRITPIDDKKVNEGTEFNYMGVPLIIARSNNDKFKKLFRTLSKPYQRDIEKGTLSDEVSTEILCKSLAGTVLVGWDQDKMPGNFPYSVENATSLLYNDPDCRDFVMNVAREAENFFVSEQEEKLGN